MRVRLRSVDLVIAVAGLVVLAYSTWPRNTAVRQSPVAAAGILQIGHRLALNDVAWSATPQTLVLHLLTTCSACNESAEFYRRVSLTTHKRRDGRFVVASSEPIEMTTTWLRDKGIEVDAVVPAPDFAALGVLKIPTMELVNSEGVITDLLVGVTTKEQEELLFAAIEAPAGRSRAVVTNVVPILEASAKEWAPIPDGVLVDVSKRDGASASKAPGGALHIPLDELVLRAPHELEVARGIDLWCGTANIIQCRTGGLNLTQLGYKRVRLVVSQ